MGVHDFDLAAYLRRLPGARPTGLGTEWIVPCPICGGREHLYVNVERRCGHCFRCDWRTGLIALLATLEGRPHEEVAHRVGRLDAGAVGPDLEAIRGRVFALGARGADVPTGAPSIALPDAFVPLDRLHAPDVERHLAPFRAYVESRGISMDIIRRHGIGCALAGRYAARVIFPVHLEGHLVAFQARDITGRSAAKYIGPPGVRLGEVLFNLDDARTHDRIVLCEGIVSAIRTGPDAVACFGKALCPAQVGLLARASKPVVVLFDGENRATGAGDAQLEALVAARSLRRAGIAGLVARLPSGDPADHPSEHVRAVVDAAAPFDELAGLQDALNAV